MPAPPPMREPTYFVLAALLAGPLHGYAIMKRAGELSGGRVRLATGTLYTALDRLTAAGQVRLVAEETVAGRVRRTYGLTESGSSALRAEAQRMAEAARLVIDGAPDSTTAVPLTYPLLLLAALVLVSGGAGRPPRSWLSESLVFHSSGTGFALGLQIGPAQLIGVAIPLAVAGALVWRLRHTRISQPR